MTNSPKLPEDVERRFDDAFPQFDRYPEAFLQPEPNRLRIKSFLASELAKAREEVRREERQRILDSIPIQEDREGCKRGTPLRFRAW